MCARSKGDLNSLIPNLGSGNKNSVLWRFVDAVIGRTGLARELIHQQFRILIGDGSSMDF